MKCVMCDGQLEEKLVKHFEFDGVPTKAEIIKMINDEWDIDYDENYDRIAFYEV